MQGSPHVPLEAPLGVTDPLRGVDFVARLAEAWDGVGRHPFAPPREHLALLGMAGLGNELANIPWSRLKGYQRQALLFAARRAVDLGRACAWVFGEGRGA